MESVGCTVLWWWFRIISCMPLFVCSVGLSFCVCSTVGDTRIQGANTYFLDGYNA